MHALKNYCSFPPFFVCVYVCLPTNQTRPRQTLNREGSAWKPLFLYFLCLKKPRGLFTNQIIHVSSDWAVFCGQWVRECLWEQHRRRSVECRGGRVFGARVCLRQVGAHSSQTHVSSDFTFSQWNIYVCVLSLWKLLLALPLLQPSGDEQLNLKYSYT